MPTLGDRLGQLFDELKRRNVFRVAVAYVVTTWLVLQVADVVLNNIEAPRWIFSVFLLALALGFIPVLIFSWAYELTPEGLKRESEVDRSRSITGDTGRKLNMITIAMLVAVVAFVLMERTFFRGSEEVATAEAPDAVPEEVVSTSVDDRSIAVLAFEDLSQQGDQAFFAEGLSEELLNVLAQVPGLKVAGRTSSFAFKGKDADLREIGEVLNVAHILEGSVRKAGNRIRVTAQLIKADDGFHLFSKTYDRDLDDIFSLQDELAALIGDALKAELVGEDAIPSAMPTNVEAYDLYLLARQRIRSRIPELMFEAVEMLDEALAIDANYAPALAQKALAVYLLSDSDGAYGDIPAQQATAEADGLLQRALAVNPDLAEAHAVLGLIRTDDVNDEQDAIPSLRRALEINPNLESAKLWLANAIDDSRQSIRLYEEVILRDPMYRPAFNNVIQNYMIFGDVDKSDALISRVERITGIDDSIHQARGTVDFVRGDLADAYRRFDLAYQVNPNASIVKLWLSYTLVQLGDMERASTDALDPLRLIAYRELGDFEAADALLASFDYTTGDVQRRVRHAADYLAAAGRADEMVALVEQHFRGAEQLVGMYPQQGSAGSEFLGPLAYVYRQAGRHDDYQMLMDELERVLSFQVDQGIDVWWLWYCRAQQAALLGNNTAATAHLQRALDDGLASVIFIEPLFDLMADDEAFQAVVSQMIERGNVERDKLGWAGYQPIAITN